MFWAPDTKACPPTPDRIFPVTPGIGLVLVVKLGAISQERLKEEIQLLSNPNRRSYMPCRFAQQWMILSDLE